MAKHIDGSNRSWSPVTDFDNFTDSGIDISKFSDIGFNKTQTSTPRNSDLYSRHVASRHVATEQYSTAPSGRDRRSTLQQCNDRMGKERLRREIRKRSKTGLKQRIYKHKSRVCWRKFRGYWHVYLVVGLMVAAGAIVTTFTFYFINKPSRHDLIYSLFSGNYTQKVDFGSSLQMSVNEVMDFDFVTDGTLVQKSTTFHEIDTNFGITGFDQTTNSSSTTRVENSTQHSNTITSFEDTTTFETSTVQETTNLEMSTVDSNVGHKITEISTLTSEISNVLFIEFTTPLVSTVRTDFSTTAQTSVESTSQTTNQGYGK